MNQKRTILIFTVIVIVLLAGCRQADPVPIYVTPTPVDIIPTVVPTVEAATATAVVIPPTATETATPSTPTPLPPTPGEGTAYGPIVPPEYTLAPTNTPYPTQTFTPGPSFTPGPPTETQIPPPSLDSAEIGVQIHPRITMDEWSTMVHWAHELGVDWIKIQYPWDEMEPDGAGSQSTHYRELELMTQAAYSAGFDVLISITKAPDWSRPTNEQNGPPNNPQLLANFITAILNSYGPAISAIEVWNEPNLEREWFGATMSGAEYMRLFDPAYNAITAYNQQTGRDIKIITAGLAPVGSNIPGVVDDRVFLQQMYNAGLANYPDVILGVHPYSWGNAPWDYCCDNVDGHGWDEDPRFFFRNTVEDYRQIMANNGHSSASMWLTEVGWATYDGLGGTPPEPWFDYTSEQQQAQYMIYMLDLLQNSGSYDYVSNSILWNLNFAMIEGAIARQEEQAGYSLLRPDETWRPAFAAIYEALRQ